MMYVDKIGGIDKSTKGTIPTFFSVKLSLLEVDKKFYKEFNIARKHRWLWRFEGGTRRDTSSTWPYRTLCGVSEKVLEYLRKTRVKGRIVQKLAKIECSQRTIEKERESSSCFERIFYAGDCCSVFVLSDAIKQCDRMAGAKYVTPWLRLEAHKSWSQLASFSQPHERFEEHV